MTLKKTLTAGMAGTLLLSLLVLPASAHGGRHHRNTTPSYAVCTTKGCEEAGRHDHDGVTYCGYDHTGGYCTGSSCSAHSGRHHSRGHC